MVCDLSKISITSHEYYSKIARYFDGFGLTRDRQFRIRWRAKIGVHGWSNFHGVFAKYSLEIKFYFKTTRAGVKGWTLNTRNTNLLVKYSINLSMRSLIPSYIHVWDFHNIPLLIEPENKRKEIASNMNPLTNFLRVLEQKKFITTKPHLYEFIIVSSIKMWVN